MTASLRESILAAAFTALQGMSSLPTASVSRSRATAFAKEEFPCAVLEPVADNASKVNNAKLNWDFIFVVHVGAQAKQNQIADQLADAIMSEVHAKIMSDATLDSLLIDRDAGPVAWQFNDSDATLVWASQQFRVSYRTNLADITA